jgi:hypothetical protein
MVRAQPDGGKPGVVSHVLVLSDKCEDVSSPDAWQRTYIKPGMTDQDRALAIWRTVVRYRHQTNPPNEFLGPEINVHDPLKTIHVYGVGMCCCASSNVCGLARYLGLKARGRAINAHTIGEVFYDHAWHMVDGSLMNYFLKPDGTIAAAPWKQLSIKDFHPVLHNAELRWARPKGKGDVTFKIPAPGEIVRVRMNLGYRCRDPRDAYTVWLSFDDGKTFRQAAYITGPSPGCTQYLTFSDVPAGARAAVVKLEGKEVNTACLFGLRIDVDYREPAGGFRPVRITYVWDEEGKERTDVHIATQPRETYTIRCGPRTVVKSFSVDLPK